MSKSLFQKGKGKNTILSSVGIMQHAPTVLRQTIDKLNYCTTFVEKMQCFFIFLQTF